MVKQITVTALFFLFAIEAFANIFPMDEKSQKHLSLFYFTDRYIFDDTFRECAFSWPSEPPDRQCAHYFQEARVNLEGWGIDYDRRIEQMIHVYVAISSSLPGHCLAKYKQNKEMCLIEYKTEKEKFVKEINSGN
ncbi:hypothetical protein [Roseibium salinum]|uniref:Uncharacterized protein n=1 Tax=Roseibium salinum TaxID=1604349 RepID=A0ABT3R9Z5_9HYPH|nr:hypothetical protein [Roseibium sp. DSM 29163]MCX2725831.1 hypothetical protein [Roseibium sp. DSM 29163]